YSAFTLPHVDDSTASGSPQSEPLPLMVAWPPVAGWSTFAQSRKSTVAYNGVLTTESVPAGVPPNQNICRCPTTMLPDKQLPSIPDRSLETLPIGTNVVAMPNKFTPVVADVSTLNRDPTVPTANL